MQTIVIYNSKTGFTKRYAEWIAETAGAGCLPLSEAKKNESATEEEMARVMSSSYDIADKKYTELILTCLRG